MRLGLSTLLYPHSSVEEGIEAANEIGVSYVEVILDTHQFTPDFDSEMLRSTSKILESYGLKPSVHGYFLDLNSCSQYEGIREVSLEQGKKSVRACALLGGDVVTIHPGQCMAKQEESYFKECDTWFKNYFDEIKSFAKEKNVTIGLETCQSPVDYPHGSKELLEFVKGRENVGITFDVGHVFLDSFKSDEDEEDYIVKLIEEVGDEIINVHIHDNRGENDDHLPPGEGEIDFDPIIEALAKYYDGPVLMELWKPSNPVKSAKKAKDFLTKYPQIS